MTLYMDYGINIYVTMVSSKPRKLFGTPMLSCVGKTKKGRQSMAVNENEPVDIIASGYEWICPECDRLNKLIEYPKSGKVICQDKNCQQEFQADMPEHCWG